MIVVTTPMGNIGGQVVRHLLDAGAPVRVIARDPARLPAGVRERVEVVRGSHADAAVVTAAFAGADAVLLVPKPDVRAGDVMSAVMDFARPACAALTGQGVRRVVGVSALGRGTPMAARAGLATASLAMDDLIAGTGVAYRALALPSFMENTLRQAGPIARQGVFHSPLAGERKVPACATRDIAAVAARLLLDDSWTGTASVPVLGPEDLSARDMAQIMTEVLGRPVRFEHVAGEAYKAGLLAGGMSEAMAQGMLDMATAKNEGLDNAEPRTPQATTPTSFRQWCEQVLAPAILGAAAAR